MSLTLVLAALLGSVAPVIRAAGTNGCPDAAAVSERLAGLLGGGDESKEPDLVELTQAGTELNLRLSRADGTLVAERRIPRSKRCGELADVVAALVAAWEANLHAEVAPPVPPTPPVRPILPVAPRSLPLPGEVEGTVPIEHSRAFYEVGVLPALWLGGGRFSFAGALRAAVWSRRAPVGMTVSLSATLPVDAGDANRPVRWRRNAFSGGVVGRLGHRGLFVDALAEAVVAWLVVEEEAAEPYTAFDPGLSIGLRAGTRVGRRIELYTALGAWGAAWSPRDKPAALPHWGLVSGLGASFLFGL
jgi:hypothetical protein